MDLFPPGTYLKRSWQKTHRWLQARLKHWITSFQSWNTTNRQTTYLMRKIIVATLMKSVKAKIKITKPRIPKYSNLTNRNPCKRFFIKSWTKNLVIACWSQCKKSVKVYNVCILEMETPLKNMPLEIQSHLMTRSQPFWDSSMAWSRIDLVIEVA